MVVSEPVGARAAEQGSDRASSTHPRLLQPLVPCHQGNRGVEADYRSILPQCLRALPELHYEDASVDPRGPTTGPVVNVPILVVRFGQAVVSAKSVRLKTMDPSKPETFMHLSRSITPIFGRGSPCQVFLCPVKKGTEILSQTKHKRSAPEQ